MVNYAVVLRVHQMICFGHTDLAFEEPNILIITLLTDEWTVNGDSSKMIELFLQVCFTLEDDETLQQPKHWQTQNKTPLDGNTFKQSTVTHALMSLFSHFDMDTSHINTWATDYFQSKTRFVLRLAIWHIFSHTYSYFP